jgi:hypothetical protein
VSTRVLLGVIGFAVFVTTVAVGLLVVGIGDSSVDVSRAATTNAPAAVNTSELDITSSESAPETTRAPVAVKTPETTRTTVDVTVSETTVAAAPVVVDCRGTYIDRGSLPLSPCDKGFGVELLQEALNGFGYAVVVDGYYGQGTADSVRAFQIDEGLPATGVSDPATWVAAMGERPGYDIDGDGVIGPNEMVYD